MVPERGRLLEDRFPWKLLAKVAGGAEPDGSFSGPSPAKASPSKPMTSTDNVPRGPWLLERPAPEDWTELIGLTDPQRDAFGGQWSRTSEGLMPTPGKWSQIMLPAALEGAYEMEVVFTRHRGKDTVYIGLPVGTHACNLALSTWAGEVHGLEMIDGVEARDNPDSVRPGTLENARKHTVLIRVAPNRDKVAIDVLLDCRPLLSWQGFQKSLSLFQGQDQPDWRRPTVGVTHGEDMRVAFHSVRIRRLPAGWALPGMAGITVPEKLVPVAHFAFDKPAERFHNSGSLGAQTRLEPRGSVTFTKPGHRDAPPKALGDGARLVDDNQPGGLIGDRSLLTGRAWTVAVWFRRNRATNDDFLVYLRGLDGYGGGSPELNVILSPKNDLEVNDFPDATHAGKQYLLSGVPVKPQAWHHLALTFETEKKATDGPGRLRVYLDGRRLGEYDDVFIAGALRSGRSALVFGCVYLRYVSNTWERTLDGVLADIRIFDLALTEPQVKELLDEVASSVKSDSLGQPSHQDDTAGRSAGGN